MTPMSFQTILDTFRGAATSNRDLGDKFERLIVDYLLTDPRYADVFRTFMFRGGAGAMVVKVKHG